MQFHPLADIFPLLEGDDLEALADDIKAHGQREPIITLDGMILDGRNRYRACEIAGVEPITQDYTGPEDKALEYVISLNVHRRHLSTSQRAMAAARMANIPHGGDRKSSKDQETNLSLDQAAKLMNVHRNSVKTARKVLEHGAEELIEKIDQGQFAVSDAVNIVDLDKQDQAILITKVDGRIIRNLTDARAHMPDMPALDAWKECDRFVKSVGGELFFNGLKLPDNISEADLLEVGKLISKIEKAVRLRKKDGSYWT